MTPKGPENKNPVLDPKWAKAEIERAYKKQLSTLREMCDYGSGVLQRSFKDCDKTLGDAVVLGMLFRHFLATFDAVVTLFENGAIYAAQTPLRGMLETAWTIEWMLKEGTDYERRCFYVAHLRNQRTWLRALIPRTPEQKTFKNTGPTAERIINARTAAQASAARCELREITKVLRRKRNRDINAKFARREDKMKKRKTFRPGTDVAWHNVCSKGGPPRVLARDLDREYEYTIYRSLSYGVHGSSARQHVSVNEQMLTIEPVRSPVGFDKLLPLATSLAMRVYEVVLAEYRPDEDDLPRKYATVWRDPITRVPQIVEKTEHTDY